MTVSSGAGWLAVGTGWLDWQPVVKTAVASAAPNKHKQDFLKKDIQFPFARKLEGPVEVGCKVSEFRCRSAIDGKKGSDS